MLFSTSEQNAVAGRPRKGTTSPDTDAAYTTEVYEATAEIDAAAWGELCGEDVYMDIRLLRAVERSMHADTKFRYVLFRNADGTAAACACLCTYSVDGSVLVSDGIAGRTVAALKQIAATLTTYKVVFCGLPFSGGHSHIRLDSAANYVSILKSLDEIMLQIAQKDGAKCIVLKEFQDCELPVFDNIASLGYLHADSLPMNQVDVRHPNFDAFLSSLPNRRRRKIGKSLKKFKDGGLRFEWVTDAAEVDRIYTDEVHQMYTEMVSRSDTKLELLPRKFFPAMVRELQGECKLCVAKEGDNILAFVLCLVTEEELSPLFAGYNYARNREFDLYFNLMYVAVGEAMASGKKIIKLGQNADYCKNVKFGVYQTGRSFYIKGVGFVMSSLIRLLSRQLFPARPLTVFPSAEVVTVSTTRHSPMPEDA